MNDNKFPKDNLKNGMFGAVRTRHGIVRFFVLIQRDKNKFCMVYKDFGYDIIGDDIERNFSIEDGCAGEYGKIIYLVSGEFVNDFDCAKYHYENKLQDVEFVWRRYSE